jgi:hypothetical protein
MCWEAEVVEMLMHPGGSSPTLAVQEGGSRSGIVSGRHRDAMGKSDLFFSLPIGPRSRQLA